MGSVLVAGGISVLAVQAPAGAATTTYVVNSSDGGAGTAGACASGGSGCTLSQAVTDYDANLSGSDTISFASGTDGQTISPSTTLTLSNTTVALTITGNGDTSTVISGGNTMEPFSIPSGTAAVTIADVTIEDGSSYQAGAIDNESTLTATRDTFSGNISLGNGGAISNGNGGTGTLTVTDSTFSGNTAGSVLTGGVYGGAISNGDFSGTGTLTVTDSTFSGNTAFAGGAIGSGGSSGTGTATITDSTFSGNTATSIAGGGGHGGAIDSGDFSGFGILTVTGSTFSGNTADYDGGAIDSGDSGGSGTVSLGATIIANSTNGGNCSGSGSYTSVGYNLTDDSGTDCGLSTTTHDLVNTDADLGTLQNNGGPTQTMAPSATSPAVAAIPVGTTLNTVSVCPGTDQRGVARPQPSGGSACSIGAVEVAPATTTYVVNSSASDSGADGACAAGTSGCTLSQAVADYDLNPSGRDTITFASGIDGQTISPSATLALSNPAVALTITGNGAAHTVISGDTTMEPFSIPSGTAGVTIEDLTIEDGSASQGGAIDNESTLTVTNDTFSDNSSSGEGGAIDSGDDGTGVLTATNDTFSGNTAAVEGGAINSGYYYGNGTLTATNDTFSGNTATYDGGAIDSGDYNGTGAITATDDTFSQNTATTYDGGAIDSGGDQGSGTITATNDTFSGNTASEGDGGAIDSGDYNGTGTLTATDDTFSGNTAILDGGAIDSGDYFTGHGTLTATDDTFSGNTAILDGGAIDSGEFSGTGTVSLGATIIVNSTSGGNCAGSGYTSVGYNLTDDSGADCGLSTTTRDLVYTDADLGTLQNNGGPTQTMAPSPSSPAVAAIPTSTVLNTIPVCPGVDQRGVYRPQPSGGSACSIGSVEVAPQAAPVITSAASATFTVGKAGTFQVTATGNPTASLGEIGDLPNGVTFVNNGDGTATLSGTPATGTGGSYPLTILATNGVTPDASQGFTLTVNEAPAFTSQASATFTVGTAGSFNVTASGYPHPAFSVIGALPSGVTLSSSGLLSGIPAAGTGGSYPVALVATNGVSPDATQAFTLTVNEAPTITSPDATSFVVGAAGSFQMTASGYPASTFSETGALPHGVTLSPSGLLSGTPAAGTGGTYPLTITATNAVTHATQNFTLTVNQSPAITSASSTTFTVGQAGTFTVTATGVPDATFSEIGTLPEGVTLSSGGVLSGTPAAGTGGSYPIALTATNGTSPDASQAFTLTVNQAPTITSQASTTFATGQAGSFQMSATGYPAPAFSETGALPSGVSISSAGLLSGTPAAGTGGTYPITVTATNGVTPDATQDFTLTVNEAPAITSSSSTTFTVGTAGSFQVTASGIPGATFSVVGTLPSGVSLSSQGLLSGTPATGSAGSYPVALMATNGTSPDASQAFTLAVHEPPAITSANAATFTQGTKGSFQVTATGTPAPTFTETGVLPKGVTLSASGLLSGTPAFGSPATAKITITATNAAGQATQHFTLTVKTATTLRANQRLTANQSLIDGPYRLTMQSDGNLVLYDHSTALWASKTAGHTGDSVTMQSDGNLVVYGPGGRALWNAGTEGHSGAYAIVQGDGNFVIYTPTHVALWASGTAGR